MKKNIRMIGGIVVLALLLGSAAFVGGRLLNGQGLPSLHQGAGSMVQRAEELPQSPADVNGFFESRQDNSIFVTSPTSRESSDSIQYEVVVTTQTIIYEDVTAREINGKLAPGQTTQQVLEPGSLDGVGQGSQIIVWGNKTGNHIIADVLVYTPPEFIKP